MEAWQVIGEPADELRARNVYFESTPLHLFTGIVTERGILSPEDTGRIIRHRREAYQRAFRLIPHDERKMTRDQPEL